jgi:Na+/melibiose symporter-like transporter
LVDANTKLSITESFAEIVGPGLAGVLVQLITAPLAVLIDAFTYLLSALSIWSVRYREPDYRSVQEPLHLSKDIRVGMRAILQNRVLLALTLTAATSSIFAGIVFTMDVLFAIRTLHLGPALFGLTVTFGGIGAIIGASAAQPLIRRFGYGPLLVVSAFLDGICAWLIPLAHGPVWLATLFLMGAQLLGDLFGVIYGVLESSLRQAVTHNEVLGRVNSTVNLLTGVLSPLGSLLGAWLATAYSLRIAMAVGVGGIAIAALWLLTGPLMQLRSLPETLET